MENIVVNRYMRLLSPLAVDIKLALLSRLSESLREEYVVPSDKESLLEELSGAWKDTSSALAEDIISARTINTREINFD